MEERYQGPPVGTPARRPENIPPPAGQRAGTRFGNHYVGHERDRRTVEAYMRAHSVAQPPHLAGTAIVAGPDADAPLPSLHGKGAAWSWGKGKGASKGKGQPTCLGEQTWSGDDGYVWRWHETAGYRKGRDGSWASAVWNNKGGGWIATVDLR